MTKQEEIREGIAARCFENCDGSTQEQCDKLNEQYEGVAGCRYCGADQVLRYLHSQGVVIKTDRGLPSIFDSNENGISALEYKKKLAGYEAVESLIEDK